MERGIALLIPLLLFFMLPCTAFSQEVYVFDGMGEGGKTGERVLHSAEVIFMDAPDCIVENYKRRAVRPDSLKPPPEIEAMIKALSYEEGIDPAFVMAVMAVESGFNPDAVSPAGACGLMQLMPETARAMRVSDIFDSEQNTRGGIRYLKSLLKRFGTIQLALAAYNAGPDAVERFGGIPPYPETEEYVRIVTEIYGMKK
ncbi:MAG: lytic transglycosylase domain-containing protein [bacterium]|nr:lytic transglycosylase domain-containing protein [bacterium]